MELPLLVKPLIRLRGSWDRIGGGAKARRVATAEELRELWRALGRIGVDVLAQELVPGPESRIESYHAYVGDGGETVAEFTGAKIRTSPPAYGNSTALTTTAAPDVVTLGRSVLRRLQFTGVAKVDFKRAPDGTLKILEVNPRFNLWHHLAAVAGLNIPALVYADLVGCARPPVAPVRPGVTWSAPWPDLRAFRAAGRSPVAWAAWTARCDAVSGFAWDDPLPFVCGQLAPRVAGRLRPRRAPPPGGP
jgi:predicted ATP-grasp superfamily ATP-dependent carboligase